MKCLRLLQPRSGDYDCVADNFSGGGNARLCLCQGAGGSGGFCIGAATKHGYGDSEKHACKQGGATYVVFADCFGVHDGFLWVRLVVCIAFVDVVTLRTRLLALKRLPTDRKNSGAN